MTEKPENEPIYYKDLIEGLRVFKPQSNELIPVIEQLIDLVKTIPVENVHKGSFVAIKNNGEVMEFTLFHAKDQLRVIQLTFRASFIFVNVCYMKDSLTHRLKESNQFSNLSDLVKVYFDAIFYNTFSKKISYTKNNDVFDVELCFESNLLNNKLYASRPNQIKRKLFGMKNKIIKEYKYYSFFDKNLELIENEIKTS